ncbi:LPD3 domain-containing protein [Oscillibacter hominis]|nr:ADP-ribosyltransferase [Oscillibacter hominis]
MAQKGMFSHESRSAVAQAQDDVLLREIRTSAGRKNTAQRGENAAVEGSQDFLKQQLFGQQKTASEEAAGPVHVGRATTIQAPYQGKTPVQAEKNIVPLTVDSNSVRMAQSRIEKAKVVQSGSSGAGFKAALKNAYKAIFQSVRGVPVEGTTFQGQPYTVDINNNVPGKVINDPNLSAEKLALLDILPEVVRGGEYVGSGRYVQHGSKQKKTVRYDYFEAPVTINGRSYIATFDVEVEPNVNNYRTHKLIEMDLKETTGPDVGPAPTATTANPSSPVEGMHPLNSDPTIAQGADSVNNDPLQSRLLEDTIEESPLLKQLSEEEQGALRSYKSSESYKLNAKLREGAELSPQDRDMVRHLDSALSRLPTYQGRVYRNLIFDDVGGKAAYDSFLATHIEDVFISYNAYTSVSTSSSGYPVEGTYVVRLVIDSTTAKNAEGFGNNFEQEAIYGRDHDFFVDKVVFDRNGVPTIYMQEAAQDGTRDNGQLHSQERGMEMRAVQALHQADADVRSIPGGDSKRGAGRQSDLRGANPEGAVRRDDSLGSAVFNPATSAREFAGGAVVSGILGGGQMLASKAIDAATRPSAPAQAQDNILLREIRNSAGRKNAAVEGSQDFLERQLFGQQKTASGEAAGPIQYTFMDGSNTDGKNAALASAYQQTTGKAIEIPDALVQKYSNINNDPAQKLINVVKQFYEKHLKGQQVGVRLNNGVVEIMFENDGKKKATGWRMKPEKAASFERLLDLVKNSEYAYSEVNRNANEATSIPRFHYFTARAVVDGAEVPVKIQVRDVHTGANTQETHYYTHNLQNKRGSNSPVAGAQSANIDSNAYTSSLINPTIAQGAEFVNGATERSHNTRILADESQALGKQGVRAVREFYDGRTNAADYFGAFSAYYQAGLSDMDMGKVKRRYAGTLNRAQRQAAYLAGQTDATASLAREKRAAKFAAVAGEDSGLIFDDYVEHTLDNTVADRVNRVAKNLGMRVRFADSVGAGAANAQITGYDVLVEKNNPKPVMFLMGHEMTHRMQELAPEEYRAFRSAAMEAMKDARVHIASIQALYAQNGKALDMEAAVDELAADYAGHMIEDGKVLDEFIQQNKDNRTLLQKIRDAIRSLIGKLTGTEKYMAQIAEEKLAAALKAAAKQAEALNANKNAAQEDGATRYSLNVDFGAQFDQWLQEDKKGGGYFQIGTTSDALKSIGMADYKIYWHKSKISKIMNKHPAMTAEVIKSIPDVLEHPILVMQSQTMANRITMFGEATDAEGKPVLVVVELSPQNKRGEVMDFAVIASAYGKNNAQQLIDSSDILYV